MVDLEYVRFLERAPTLVLGQLNQNLSSSVPTRRPPKPLRSASSSRNRSLHIPGLRDKALHAYYLWHCTQVRGADLKQHFKHAYDIAVARGLDPELIARHGDAAEYIEKGVLEGVAKRWVSDIRAWVDEVRQET